MKNNDSFTHTRGRYGVQLFDQYDSLYTVCTFIWQYYTGTWYKISFLCRWYSVIHIHKANETYQFARPQSILINIKVWVTFHSLFKKFCSGRARTFNYQSPNSQYEFRRQMSSLCLKLDFKLSYRAYSWSSLECHYAIPRLCSNGRLLAAGGEEEFSPLSTVTHPVYSHDGWLN